MHQRRSQGAYQSDTALSCGGINGTAKNADISPWIGILDRTREPAPGAALK